MNAETCDFLFNRRDLKILSEDHFKYVPCTGLWIGSVQGFRYWR
jgi:hypothetical protein